MDMTNSTQSKSYKPKSASHAHVGEAASDLLRESKKKANELYEEGRDRMCGVQESIKEYSDEVAHKVHAKPFTSLLIAGGIGFILAALFRR